MLEPIVRTVEVPCDRTTAFSVLLEGMAAWWPLEQFSVSAMGGAPAQTLLVEAHKEGRIIEVAPNGREFLWGTITACEPSVLLALDFHIPQPEETVRERSHLSFSFTALSDTRCEVELRQENWEAFGRRAETLRSGYAGAWPMILDACYREACGG